MARLPQPGGDSGNWGSILNDYLSQAHKTDGTLKDDVVAANALASNAVVESSLADSAVTKPKLASSVQASLNKADTSVQPADIQSKVNKSDLFLNARDYGVLGNGTDETSAITALFTAALSINSVPGVTSGTTYRTPTIYFPAGTYSWSTKIIANLSVSSPANRDRRRLIIKGDGEGATVFKPTYALDAGLHVKNGLLTISGIRWIGTGSNSFLRLGDPVTGTSYVNQFKVESCAFHNGGDMIIFDWCFDGAFQDVQFSSIGAGKSGILVNPHEDDNCNNVSFIRCHWEPAGAGVTMVKVRGGALTAQRHSQFNFVSCHFETRRYDCMVFDIENANSFNITGTRIVQNEDSAGTSLPSSALPMFRLVTINSFALSDCVVGRVASSTTDTWLNKIFSVGGSARAIKASGTFFAPYTTSSSEAKASLWQSDSTIPYITDGTSVIEFSGGCSIGSRSAPKVSDDVLTVTSANARNRNWSMKIDDTNSQQLRYYYSNDSATLDSSSAYKFGVGTDGVLSLRNGITSAAQSTIANNATAAYDLVGINNGSKRALYIIIARTPSEHTWALVYSSGVALNTIAAGSDMAVGTTNQSVSGKFNIYLNGSVLTVQNLFGSSALVSCVPVGF
ncbi:hypothetical protein HY312_00610 [Candidatus Saccharibacteria bacterium]|nr:hypothetical protein [Candidatus Saccharibacteria bacterium]